MFLKEQPFKKILKKAYSGGLIVGNTGERIYLSGWTWEMDIDRKHLPKTILAKIIELAGELPAEGECFSATKSGNQMEMRTLEDMRVGVKEYSVPVEKTKILINTEYGAILRALQIKDTKKIVLIRETSLDMVDSRCIDKAKGEVEPMGPFYAPEEGIFWSNNVMTFKVLYATADEAEQDLITDLEGLKLWKG